MPIIVHQVQASGQHHGSLILILHRLIRISSCAWLTDSIINAAQMLIKRGNPLVRVVYKMSTWCSNRRIYTETPHWAGGHWHVVSTIGTNYHEVNVFDSMYCHCSDHSKVQISRILRTEQKFSSSTIMYKCSDGWGRLWSLRHRFCNCTIKWITSRSVLFWSDNDEVTSAKLLRKGKIETFPVRKEKRVNNMTKRFEQISVYCNCRRPITQGSEFIQCGACREWYIPQQYLCTGGKQF